MREFIRGNQKFLIKPALTINGNILYDVELYEFYPLIGQWQYVTIEHNYTKEAILSSFGIVM